MFWDTVRALFDRLGTVPKVAVAFLGCGLARAWLWWMLSLVCYSDAYPAYTKHQGHLLFDLGEILGFLLLFILARRFAPFFKRPSVAAAALTLTIGTSALTLWAPALPIADGWAIAIIVLGGVGYALLFLLWLELYGCLTARSMLIAWTGSYFVALLIWGLDQIVVPGSLDVVLCLLPAGSLLMLFKGFCSIPLPNLPVAMTHWPAIPWKLIVALSAFALAFGIGDAVTGQNMFTWVSKVGMGIPELLVLLSALFFYRQFSFKYLVTVAAPFVVAGLIGAFFVSHLGISSFVLVNASSEIYLILVYAVACITAYKLNISAVYLAGLFAGLYKVFLQAGKGLGLVVAGQLHDSAASTPALAIVMVVVVVIASIVLVQDRNVVDKFSWREQNVDPRNATCARIAEEYRLTPKEGQVFLMLAQKQDTAQIAEELFLAQSTVRVHTSSIYKKLGVHSRKELDELVDRQIH